MSDHESDSRQTARTALIPESAVRRIFEDHRARAELALVTSQLNDVPEFKLDPTAKVSDYVDGLVRRRGELLNRDKLAPTSWARRSQQIDPVVTGLDPLPQEWIAASLPQFTEGADHPPPSSFAYGDFYTDSLLRGGAYFHGFMEENGPLPDGTALWWGSNWIGSYVFPPPSQDSWLFYRFATQVIDLDIEDSSRAGALIVFTNVSTISDVSAGSLFAPGATLAVNVPVWVILNHSYPYRYSPGVITTPMSGSIQVQAGQSPAIGFVYGAIAGLSGGELGFFGPAGLMTCLSPDTTYPGNPAGLIEYHYEPDWWIRAVARRQNEAASASRVITHRS